MIYQGHYMINEICIIEGCTRFRDKKQNRRICQMHRVRYGRYKSYDLPTSPKLPDGILKICKIHGSLTSLGVYKKFKDKDWLYCRECIKESNKRTKKKNGHKRKFFQIANKKIKVPISYYDELLKKQNNTCAICKKPETVILIQTNTKPKRLAIDHCHKTNKIRGLLCQKCNTAIGAFNDSIEMLQSAIKYLEKYN